jgi:hypothetical protein
MRIEGIFGLATVLFVAACAVAPIEQDPVQYQATTPLHEKGTTNFTVRTYDVKDGLQELTGVPCEFKGEGFHASFTTPAVVVAPDMGPRTPVASLTCSYNGQKSFQIVQPVNITLQKIDENASASGAGAGIVGLIVSGISDSAQRSRRDATLDIYGYPNLVARFK